MTYESVVRFIFDEIPPADHNFLTKIDDAMISEKFESPAYGSQKNSLCSVIIPTYNREKTLVKALLALHTQKGITHSDFELVVVDDGSSDNTFQMAKVFSEANPSLSIRLIRLRRNLGVSYARNVGILNSRSGLVCFTDDDCIVPGTWLREFIIDFENHPEISASGGWHPKALFKSKRTLFSYLAGEYSKRSHYPWNITNPYKSDIENVFNKCGNTANICYKKSALFQVGGFNHYFRYPSSEDWELKIRLHKQRRTLFYNGRLVWHLRPPTLSDFIRGYVVRGWARFLISKIHTDYDGTFELSYKHSFPRFLLEISRLMGHYEDLPRLSWRAKCMLIWIAVLKAAALWVGKYVIPMRIVFQKFNFRVR